MISYLELIKKIAIPNKYTKYYCNIIEKALLRPQDRKYLKEIYGYVESHHILPKCFGLGGEKDKNNLVFLTAKEHFVVHLCATKMFESSFKNKMIFAFRQLKSSNKYQKRYMNSRLYEKIKPNRRPFVVLYNKSEIKYIPESETQTIENLKLNGWVTTMTEEYKDRIGCRFSNQGRTVSEETRKKLSIARKNKPNLALKGQKRPKEVFEKRQATIERDKLENPEKYKQKAIATSEMFKQMYRDGILDCKGENNGMFGKTHSEEMKREQGQRAKERWKNIKENPKKYKKEIDQMRIARQKFWKNNSKSRELASLHGTTAYRKYKMDPQEYYDKHLKPLLYFGFLPSAIVRYKLIDMSKGNIKALIWKYGTEADKLQFEANKKKAAGANKAYIKFQEDQYNKYFKDKAD